MAVTQSTLKATVALRQAPRAETVSEPRDRSLLARFVAYWTAGPASLSGDPEPSRLVQQHRVLHPFDISYRR